MRQSTVAFGRIYHIFPMKVDPDLIGELSPDDGWNQFFAAFLLHFSHSVRMDMSAHFSAFDDEKFFVVEGDAGSQSPRCSAAPTRSVHALVSMVKHDRHTSCPHHNHHHHHTP